MLTFSPFTTGACFEIARRLTTLPSSTSSSAAAARSTGTTICTSPVRSAPGDLVGVGILAHPGRERAEDLAGSVHEANGGALVLQRTLLRGATHVIDVGLIAPVCFVRFTVATMLTKSLLAPFEPLPPFEPSEAFGPFEPACAPVVRRAAVGAKSFPVTPFSALKRSKHARCSCGR